MRGWRRPAAGAGAGAGTVQVQAAAGAVQVQVQWQVRWVLQVAPAQLAVLHRCPVPEPVPGRPGGLQGL